MTFTDSTTGHDTYLDEDFARWLDSLLLEAHQPGVSIAVVKDGQVESAGFGLAQLPDVAATSKTLWPMASTTKAFTTALLGKLLEDQAKSVPDNSTAQPKLREISWKTPVSEILPVDFVTTDDYVTKHATIEDIASHRSGVAGHDLIWGPVMGNSLNTGTKYLRHLEAIEDKFRSVWQYNNLMYSVLGNIIEQSSAQSYDDALHDRILRPLGMRNTSLGMPRIAEAVQSGALPKSQVARGYYWYSDPEATEESDNTKGFYIADYYPRLDAIEPAGALVSSVDDFSKWVLALLQAANRHEGTEEGPKPVISEDLWKEMTTPRAHIVPTPHQSTVTQARPSNHAAPTSYCLGWIVDPHMYPGEIMISHGGGLPGFSSLVALLPDRDIGVVIAGNGGMSRSICEAVSKELFGRRLGMSKEDRRKRAQEAEKLAPVSVKETPLQAVPSITTEKRQSLAEDEVDGDTEAEVSHLEGHYVHPAYRTFHITAAPSSAALTERCPTIDGARILRQKGLEGQNADSVAGTSSKRTSTASSLLIRPIGTRGLASNLLLHPAGTQPDQGRKIYDLETIWLHGDLADDTTKTLQQVITETSEGRYPLKNIKAWQSIGIKDAAAVFELVDSADGASKRVSRVGLRMMRVDGAMDSKKKCAKGGQTILEEGWEGRMIWMTKVSV